MNSPKELIDELNNCLEINLSDIEPVVLAINEDLGV